MNKLGAALRRVTEFLNGQPGRHLVIVTPKQSEYNLLQWIYNDADINTTPSLNQTQLRVLRASLRAK